MLITNCRPSYAPNWLLVISLGLTLIEGFLPVDRALSQDAQVDAVAVVGPTKNRLIETLRAIYPLLEKRDFATASKHFVLPPDFRPEMLDGFIAKHELSMPGIDILESSANFGSARDQFGAKRATNYAARASVSIEHCFGFCYKQDNITAEVMAVWDEDHFRIIRMDDVGKLKNSDMPNAQSVPVNQLSTEQLSRSLPALQAAADSKPPSAAALADYAFALYRLGNLPEAWTKLSQARKLEPRYSVAIRGSEAVLLGFEEQGLLSLDVPMETIESLLGKPEKTAQANSGMRWQYAHLAIEFDNGRIRDLIDLRGITEDLFKPNEIVRVDLDGRGWVCKHRRRSKGVVTAYFYLPTETIADWTEQLEVERILDGASVGTGQEIADALVLQMQGRNKLTQHQILRVADTSAIVAFEWPGPEGEPRRYQLVRMLQGAKDVHRLSLTVKRSTPLPEEFQQHWLKVFETAKLEPVQ